MKRYTYRTLHKIESWHALAYDLQTEAILVVSMESDKFILQ